MVDSLDRACSPRAAIGLRICPFRVNRGSTDMPIRTREFFRLVIAAAAGR